MKTKNTKSYLFDDPAKVRLLVRSLVVVCVLLFGLDLLLHRHVEHPWEALPGFYSLYGFVACVVLVLLAKELRKLVMRKADYYQQRTDSILDPDPDPDPDIAESPANPAGPVDTQGADDD
ncbi:MAG: hypothetical protein V7739_14465 [Motiliproteus sp.]